MIFAGVHARRAAAGRARARRRGHGAARVALAVAPLVIALIGCDRLPTAPASRPRASGLGIALVDWSADGYATPAATEALDALTATGANTVTVIITAYQASPGAATLRTLDPRTPSPGAVRVLLAAARARGLSIALKPHVDLDDGSWRGRIEPADPDAWFRSYRDFLRPWVALAESIGASQFVIGTELAGTIGHESQWRETIREARAAFSGQIVYAASWDEASRVPFWSALDRVGVDFYFPVESRRDAGRLEMLAGWQPWLERLRALHTLTKKPILITEVGYRSVDGAGLHPYAPDSGAPIDLTEQADLYWAALEATANEDWIAGLWWWNWPANGTGGPLDRDYTPRGKPAEEELRRAWTEASASAIASDRAARGRGSSR